MGNGAGFRYFNGKAIDWDAYNFPAKINNSTSEYINFYYDGNHARWKSVYVNGSTTETTIHVGDLMEKVMSSANSTVDYRHYIYAGSSRTPVAVYSRTGTANSQNKVRYLLDDPQDSVVSILASKIFAMPSGFQECPVQYCCNGVAGRTHAAVANYQCVSIQSDRKDIPG